MTPRESRRKSAKSTSVVCWKCLSPINQRSRFCLDYVFAPVESFKRPFSTFGFCTQCRPQGGLGFFVGEEVQTIPEGDLYTGYAALDPGKKITALWTRSGKSSGRKSFERARRRFNLPTCKCPCGNPSTELHHIIPRYWFRLNRLAESASHFVENLLPVCSACNKRLYNFTVFASDAPKYWAKNRKAFRIFQTKLTEALAVARVNGLNLYQPPELNFDQLPGQPVLTKPNSPTERFLKVAAFIDVFWCIRTHSENLRPFMVWRNTFEGQGNPYMVLVSWDHLPPTAQPRGPTT